MRALRSILILTKKLKNKIQATQNKCARFCLNIDNMAHMSQNDFEKLKWLPISDRINQCLLSTTLKFVNNIGPNYFNDLNGLLNKTLRNDYCKLKHPF